MSKPLSTACNRLFELTPLELPPIIADNLPVKFASQ